jgi:hypothetical protein
MKKNYTHENIDRFYQQFNQLPEYFELEKVHQLINNPDAKAKLSGKTFFKPFKFIFMTTIFITGLTSLILWLSPTQKDNSLQKEIIVPVEYSKHGKVYENELSYSRKTTEYSYQNAKNEENTLELALLDSNLMKVSNNNSQPTQTISSDISTYYNLNCNWSKDTFLKKESLFINLTEEELLKLGVYKKTNGMEYNNGNIRIVSVYDGYKQPKNWKTHLPFDALYTSNQEIENTTSYEDNDNFYFVIDTLAPIILTFQALNNKKEAEILWFTTNNVFFKALPERYRHLEQTYLNLKCLKTKYPQKQLVNYYNPNIFITFEKVNYLTLDNTSLNKIGFQIFKDSISIENTDGTCKLSISNSCIFNPTKGNQKFPPINYPLFVTDEKGRQKVLQNISFDNGKEYDFSQLMNMYNSLVPIRINMTNYVSSWSKGLIFWFYPTEEFINSLPENMRNSLKTESESIISGTTSSISSCTYFEACKSTLQLENFKVYPNPAKQKATIEFSVNKELKGTITLVNISGIQVKQLSSLTKFKSGFNSYNIDLSGIPSGIYLVSIFSDKGFKTQRIIISQ